MKNCLVTKLKCIVDNDNLLKLGELKFNFNVNTTLTTTIKLGASLPNTCKYTSVGDGLYTDDVIPVSQSVGGAKTYNINQSTVQGIISDKYNIGAFNINNKLVDFDINSLLYCRSIGHICILNNIEIYYTSIYGDVKEFLTNYININTNREGSYFIFQIYDKNLTNVPVGIGTVWNEYSKVHFNKNYSRGWYIEAGDGTCYDSDGNVITP